MSTNTTTTINLSISKQLLHLLDEYADDEYTTRSDIIRMAVLKLLRDEDTGWHTAISFRDNGGISAKKLLSEMEKHQK